MPTGRDVYFDVPLANVAIKAFQSTEDYVGPRLFPQIPVGKQSGRYYTIDKDTWLRVHNTLRAPKTSARRIEFKVSSDGFFCDNHVLAGDLAKEDLANADNAVNLLNNETNLVVDGLLRGKEDRLAKIVTSISNIGSGVLLTGTAKWSDYVSSDPLADITSAHAFVENNTGLMANTAVLDKDTYQIIRRHPVLLDMYKYTSGGELTDQQLASVFKVQNFWVARGIVNRALEGATASLVNIWGNNVLICRVQPGVSMETATFGLSYRWVPPGIPAPMQVMRYDDPDPSKKAHVLEVGYYEDEKVVARELAYLIGNTL